MAWKGCIGLLALAGGLAPAPVCAEGTVRFSGRIVEAPCAADSTGAGMVQLSGCALAVDGARVSVRRSGAAAGAAQLDDGTGTPATSVTLRPAGRAPDGRHFWAAYRIVPTAARHQGAFQLRVDYL